MKKTDWKALVEATNARTYILPEGWDTKATLAEVLGCSEDRVRIQMAPAVKDRSVETKVFPVWDDIAKRVVRITAYRSTEK